MSGCGQSQIPPQKVQNPPVPLPIKRPRVKAHRYYQMLVWPEDLQLLQLTLTHLKLIRFSGSSTLKFLVKFLASPPRACLLQPKAPAPAAVSTQSVPTHKLPNLYRTGPNRQATPLSLSLREPCTRQQKVKSVLLASQAWCDCRTPDPVFPIVPLGCSRSPGMTALSAWARCLQSTLTSLFPAFWLHPTPRDTQGLHGAALGTAHKLE